MPSRSPGGGAAIAGPAPLRRTAIVVGALLVWLLALATAQRIPPMQSPDEHSHLARAYQLCRGQWMLETPVGNSSGGRIDRSLAELMHPSLALARDAALRLSPEQRQAIRALRWSGDEGFLPIPGTGYYLPVIYLPQAAALCIGLAIDLSVLDSYQLARGLTLALSLFCVVAATRLHAPGPLALLVLALPMSLFQLMSPTVDGLAHAMTLWVACAFVRLLRDGADASRWLLIGWLGVLAALAAVRPYLLPLFVLPLAVAWRWRRLSIAAAAGLALLAVLAWYAWAAASVVDHRVERRAGLGQIVHHYVTRPDALGSAIAGTFGDRELPLFYARSFVGILGWLDTLLPLWAYPVLWLALAATALLSIGRGLVGKAAPWLLAAALVSVPLVFGAMLVGWSAFPATRIDGVQGRYFLASALLFSVALSPASDARPAGWRHAAGRFALGVALAGVFASVAALLMALAQRYG